MNIRKRFTNAGETSPPKFIIAASVHTGICKYSENSAVCKYYIFFV